MKIEVQGTGEEVALVVNLIQGVSKEHKYNPTTTKPRMKEVKQKFNATEGILELKEERFFEKPKALLQIKRALEERGLIYPITTLSGIILKFCKRRQLRRIREGKKWEYVRGSK